MERIRKILTVERLRDWIYALALIFTVCSCVWELPVRHSARAIIIFMTIGIILYPNCLAELKKIRGILTALLAFVLMLTFEAWYGGHFKETVSDYSFWFNYNMLLIPAFFLAKPSRKRLENLLTGSALSLLIVDFYIFWQFFNESTRPVMPMGGNPMMTATLYVLLVPAIFIAALKSENENLRRLYAIFTFFNIAAAFLTGTRALWVTLGIVMFATLFFCSENLKKALLGASLILILIFSISYNNEYFQSRLASVGNLREHSQAQRLLMWQSAFNMFSDHPIFGVGTGNYTPLYQQKYILPQADEPFQMHAHSNYFQMLGECGLFGFVTYCASFGYIIYWSYLRRRNFFGMVLLSSTASFMIYSTTDYTFYGYVGMRILWFLIALCAVGSFLCESEKL